MVQQGNGPQGSVLTRIKAWVARFNAWVDRLRASEGGKALLIFISVLLTAGSVTSFAYLLPDLAKDVFALLDGIGLWIVLAIALVAVMAALAFVQVQNQAMQIVGFLLAVLIFIPFVLSNTLTKPLPLVVVYDADQPELHPKHVEKIAFPELGKLAQLNQIDSSTLFISTIHRPSDQWRKLLDNGFATQTPILSVQEVLDNEVRSITDVSFSSFADEMTYFVSDHVTEIDSIVVFFERGYASEQATLHDRIVGLDAGVTITSTTFEQSTNSLGDTEGMTLIYLGSPDSLERFMTLADKHNFQLLLLPNWLRPNVGKVANRKDGKKVVVLSSIFNKLAMADFNQWKRLFDLVDEAVQMGAEVQDYVYAKLFKEKQFVEVRF